MNTNSNSYTIFYSAGMVILVAALLAFAAGVLKTPQEKNKEIEKKMNILISVNKATDIASAANKDAYIEEEYSKYIVETFVLNAQGITKDGDAFKIDMKVEYAKMMLINMLQKVKKREVNTNLIQTLDGEIAKLKEDLNLPVFVYRDNSQTLYILPVRGRGLWGPIWGYISLKNDFSTIYGATFDHQGETPGLGAEIATPQFQQQFAGKTIYAGDKFTSIEVVKPGSAALTEHSVDGISGGTITSNALGKMLFDCLINYQAFFNVQKQAMQPVISTEPAVPATDSTSLQQPAVQQ